MNRNIISNISRWINDRWPRNAVIRWGLEEEMPGGTSYAYVFGSCVLLTFLLQIITGLWQLLYYRLKLVRFRRKITDGGIRIYCQG